MKKLTPEHIHDHVNRCEEKRKGYVSLAGKWQSTWELKAFERTIEEAIRVDGQEQVVLPTPFNVVNLAQRLISTTPKIEVPANDETGEDIAEKKERWLGAAWQRINQQQRMNVIAALTLQSLVRGRFAYQVSWVREDFPRSQRDTKFPILIRPLDPLNVGVESNWLYTSYAYHKYDSGWGGVAARYPKFKPDKDYDHDSEVCVIDYWYTDPDSGDIWNAVLVDGEYAKKPTRTNYLHIPIVEGIGDLGMTGSESHKGLSLLHPIVDLWKYQCRLASQMGTGVLYYFWPYVWATSEHGSELPSTMKVRPGMFDRLPFGTQINVLPISPNVPLAQSVSGIVQQNMDQSTFPGVMFGQAPGDLQAGYGVNLLANAAKGRTKSFVENLEAGLSLANEMMLSLVEEMGGSKGVPVWGKDQRTNGVYSLTLNKADVDGYHENIVTLEPNVPQDQAQRQTLGLRMVQDGVLSRQTFRDRYAGEMLPPDEQLRVDTERAMMSQDLAPKVIIQSLRARYPVDIEGKGSWLDIIQGTPLAKAAEQFGLAHVMPDGAMMEGPSMMSKLTESMSTGQAVPMSAPGAIQPPAITPPSGGGIPPQMQGQLTPEGMGLNNMSPEIFAQMMGRPMQPREELDRAGGLR